MENYSGSERGTIETYLFQGTKSSHQLTTTPPLERIEAMDYGGGPEFIVDQGLYYPAATNYYGYYCTGFDSPGEWSDHNRFFGLDGQDLHYAGTQIENLPYAYYNPGYGYAQSPYNPYNPFIPGAIIGVDGSVIGGQQYYTGSTYEQPTSSPAYVPLVIQPRPDIIPNSSLTPQLLNTGAPNANIYDGPGLKHSPPSAYVDITKALPKSSLEDVRAEPVYSVSNLTRSSAKISNGSIANAALSKQPTVQTSITPGDVSYSSSLQATQGRSAFGSTHAASQFSHGRDNSLRNPLKVAPPVANGVSDFGMDAHGWAAVDKPRPRLHYGGVLNNGNGSPDLLSEHNRGPRTNRSKSQWMSSTSVKAHGSEAGGGGNAHGNITIYSDRYNREDLPVKYADAKFFVIKSYSEDDVHKSVKYSVWSSTPNGNKRLDSAYEDAQRIAAGKPSGCPVFLFFSVNASGQFCGVAEMIGHVDFDKDMNFWQQDKWSGSFPVKWHIIKDVPNTNFRHIILENNENKPVTNSRDTQEVRYRQGTEILTIFKNYASKTSILDDFMYYEERQKIMQDEKDRLLGRSYDTVPAFVPPDKPNGLVDQPSIANEKFIKQNDPNNSGLTVTSVNKQFPFKPEVTNSSCSGQDNTKLNVVGSAEGVTSVLKIGSLSIDPNQVEAKPSAAAAVTIVESGAVDVVTVGSMPVKVEGFTEAFSRTLTVGTIPIDPEALKLDKPGPFTTGGTEL